MDSSDPIAPAIAETVGFLEFFKDLADPRQPGKIDYPLEEILLLCLTAVLAGAAHITEIALFGEKRIALLRRLRPFANAPRAMTISATSWPRLMPNSSSAASLPGLPSAAVSPRA